MQRWLRAAFAALLCTVPLGEAALAQQLDPPGRVGRISYLAGTVSFHDSEETQWTTALLNYPFTSGSALWTEPNGLAELVVAGTRVRLQGNTEVEAETLDDDQIRLRLPEGRVDVRAAGVQSDRPYEILTPRGTVRLMQDGEYVIEAGTTRAPTRIGVHSGGAQFVDASGSVLAVRPGEIGVVSGSSPVVFSTERLPPPPMPAAWAARDRLIVPRPAPQYIDSSVTGYEDLDAYGNWNTAGEYGAVWTPRAVPAGWAPYRNGRWTWVRPWGWTWVDEAPWGFAPFHYGRWVMINNRWSWVPPARSARPVYAPALVAFVGSSPAQLSITIGGRGPAVGWFPLGPREVYVPSYTANRAYIRNINSTSVTNAADVDRRIDYVERNRDRWDRGRDDRRDGRPDDRRDGDRWTYANQRYSTVVPTDAFVRSQPVNRAALRVQADQLARTEVAPVAAPPAAAPPARPGAAAPPDGRRPDFKGPDGKGPDGKGPAPKGADRTGPDGKGPDRKGPPRGPDAAGAPVGRTEMGGMPTLGRPDRAGRPPAPGPAIARTPGRPDTTPATPPAPGQRTVPPGASPKPGAPDDRSTTPVPPGSADRKPGAPGETPPPPTGATPPGKGPGAPPRPDDRAAPPAPAGKPDLPPLRDRGPGPQATPKGPDRTPGTPPAPKPGAAPKPEVTAPPPAPKPPERVAPPPVATPKPPEGAAPPPAPKPPERVAPPPVATPKPPEGAAPPPASKPPERIAPPPVVTPTPPERVAPPPVAAPKAPEGAAPPPAPKPPERVAPSPERIAPPPRTEVPRPPAPPVATPRSAPTPPGEPRPEVAPPPPAAPPPAPPPQRDERLK